VTHVWFSILQTPCVQGDRSKFRQLKYLQLKFFVLVEDLSNLLWLASILRAAPFIEKLEIHVSILMGYFLA